MTELERALDLVERSQTPNGPDWHDAHEIAQTHEGEAAFDALHALLHRIEGDTSNAAYWDRRAGTDFGGNGSEAEIRKIRALAGLAPSPSAP